MKSHIGRMLNAMIWADIQIFAALRDFPPAQPDALPLLGHILAAEHHWLCRLEDRDARVAVFPALTIPECEALAAENAREYQAYFGKLTEADLAAVVHYRSNKGDECTSSVIDVVTHVVIHGAYHRGQIARVIGRGGGQPPNTDYMAFVRSLAQSGA
jgi:uncharacterized damage-inducible protein DinB